MSTQSLRKRLLNKRWLALPVVILLILIGLGGGKTAFSQTSTNGLLAVVVITPRKVEWQPQVENDGLVLTIAAPGGAMYSQEYGPGDVPVFGLSDESGEPHPDGTYTYELVVKPVLDEEERAELEASRGLEDSTEVSRQVQSGHFSILDGVFVVAAMPETGDGAPADVLHYDDVIITGSLCVGFDCADGESFGFDTVVLKEHNLRIYFNDTSYTASYPTNNWRITVNDSTNGGASYFSIDDVDDGTSIFKIEAGAPSNSLYVEDYGRVGLGTSTPVVELHVKDSDTPTVRLEQDSSGGWTAQTFDIGSNESNFFIRDATNGSKLPFRIQPSTPSSTLNLKSDGSVGIGTWSPAYPLELETTNKNAVFALERTDGATGKMSVTNNKTAFGSVTNHKVQILVNNSSVAEFETDGDLSIDGYLHEGSDVNSKEAFAAVDGKDVLGRLDSVSISTWSFKASEDDARHMGPMAQDFYAAYGLGSDDKHISALDVGGVALAAIKELDAQNEALEAENVALRSNVDDLEARVEALETMVTNGASPATSPLQSNILLIVGLLLAGVILGLGLSVCLIRMTRRDSGASLLKVGG